MSSEWGICVCGRNINFTIPQKINSDLNMHNNIEMKNLSSQIHIN